MKKTAALLIILIVSAAFGGTIQQETKELIIEKTISSEGSDGLYSKQNSLAEGYRGIWYRLGHNFEHGDKYSGGLGTYTANHKPLAVNSEAANKTFFVVGGTPTEDQQYLLILAGTYDHATHKVSRPTIVYDKGAEGVYDAHDNAAISLDAEGHIWVFVAGRNFIRDGTLLRSTQPHSVEAFETISIWKGMTYPQPWYDRNNFYFFFTKYTRPRNLYFATSSDGKSWSDEIQLARFCGHYQVSGVHQQSDKKATATPNSQDVHTSISAIRMEPGSGDSHIP